MTAKGYQVAVSGTAVEDSFYGDVISLTIEEGITAPGKLRLRLNTRLQPDGTWSYLGDDRLSPFSRVTVRVGFVNSGGRSTAPLRVADGNDGLQPVFDGYVTAVDLDLASQPGNSHIELSGMDSSVLMSLEEKIVTWTNLSDSDIVRQILDGYSVEARVDDTPTVHQENDTTIIQRGTDIQFIHELAQRNGCEFFLESDKDSGDIVAYFRPPRLEGMPQPDLAIQFGIASNLRRFSARLSGQRPLSVKTQQIDVQANRTNSAQVGDSQLPPLGENDLQAVVGSPLASLVSPKDTQAQMLVLGPPTSDATELQTIAQTVRDEASWFITASGEINSEAYQVVLRPRRLVLIKGAGTQHSGKYYVTSVVHELRADGSYTQRFEARRNAHDLDGSKQFGAGNPGVPLPGGL